MCLGNILKDFTINVMKKTGLKGSVKFFPLNFRCNSNQKCNNDKGRCECKKHNIKKNKNTSYHFTSQIKNLCINNIIQKSVINSKI